MFDRELKLHHKVLVFGLISLAEFFGFIPHRRGKVSAFAGSEFVLFIALSCLAIGVFLFFLDRRTNYPRARVAPRVEPSKFQFTVNHALIAIAVIIAAFIVIELFFDVLSWTMVLVVLLVGIVPALGVVARRLGLRTGVTDGSLARDLALKMPGRSPEDMIAGTLAAIAALCDLLDNERNLGPIEIARRIRKSFPGTDQNWLKACMEMTTAANVHPERDLISTTEFYANLLASQSKVPLRKLRIVDWSLGLLYSVLFADGRVTGKEQEAFSRLAGHFGIGTNRIEEIKRRARFDASYSSAEWARETADSHTNEKSNSKTKSRDGKKSEQKSQGRSSGTQTAQPNITSALALFNLNESYSLESLEREWRSIVKKNHPDRFHFTSPELYRQAHERFLNYAAAYKLLKEQRE